MKKAFTFLLLLLSLQSLASPIDSLANAKITKDFKHYLPKGLQVIDSVQGDFNNDNLLDVVLILDSTEYKNESESSNRSLLILQKTKIGFVKWVYCKSAILCMSCGGIYGDPYSSIEIQKNILKINHYGGSAWRWTNDFTFRFQNNKWELIGISSDYFWTGDDCGNKGVGYAGRQLQEANFSISKVHIIQTKDTECKPYKDSWLSFKKKPLVTLQNFDVDKNYFPFKVEN